MRSTAAITDALVLAALTRAATAEGQCPGNDALADACGAVSTATASDAVRRLERAGKILVERGTCSRVVTIVATGMKTAGTITNVHWRHREKGVAADVQAEADRVSRRREAAKRTSVAARMVADDPEPLPPAVYREPCVRCGVRGDIGCRHTASRLTGSCFV